MAVNIREIEEKAKKCYEELVKLRDAPDVIIPGQKSKNQIRIGQLEAALAAFGLAMPGARGR